MFEHLKKWLWPGVGQVLGIAFILIVFFGLRALFGI